MNKQQPLPQLRINDALTILALDPIQKLTVKLKDGRTLKLYTVENFRIKGLPIDLYIIHNDWAVVGWTADEAKAREFFAGASEYTLEELISIARGRYQL